MQSKLRYKCPYNGCMACFIAHRDLSQHVQKHVSGDHCRSCNRSFVGRNEYLGHFNDAIGCNRKRIWDSDEDGNAGHSGAMDDVDDAKHVDAIKADGFLWKPLETDKSGGVPFLLLPREGFDEYNLHLLVHDLSSTNDIEMGKRFVSKQDLDAGYQKWFRSQSFF